MNNLTTNEIPYGYCHCGCGQKTNICPQTRTDRGNVKGEPYRYATGHHGRITPVTIRFWKYVTPGPFDECWLWQGFRDANGYGMIQADGRPKRKVFAHRVSWEIHFGPIPKNKKICHRCDNPPCQNPYHFFLGTQADNLADMYAKNRQNPRKGESVPYAKLTEAKVRTMRAQHASGEATYLELANRYGVNQKTVRDIISRKKWSHI